MAYQYNIPTWKTAPFIRIVIPLAAGIILQWNFQFPLLLLIVALACFSLDIILFRFFPISMRYKVQVLQGIIVNLLLISFGAMITWLKDIRHDDNWFGNYYQSGDYLVVKISEPPIEKEKSYKADGHVETLIHKDSAISCQGKILFYFSKDSITSAIHYGDRILIHKDIQPIKNSGNPGAFDYQRYAAFQQTYNTVFLKKEDWLLLNEKNINQFKKLILSTRGSILSVIRNNVKNEDNESGIDEALLIGYTNDLDKDLAQAYSNTGVPHIIAISGMSLGLIYMSLLWLFNKVRFIKRSAIIKMILLLICLWLFTLLTGESASVLRSAIVLTCIIIGNGFNKKSSIFNSLAASAFILLCYNPHLLWDVGFQISYLAVISILIFRKPIYNWIDIKNKWLKKLWNLVAITLSVQILTFPVCIYYFHQFPLLFLLTNITAIPLSTIILFAEIFLLALNWVPYLGIYIGKLISSLTWLLNKFILWVNSLPFALAGNLQLSILLTWLLYGIVICFSIWLIKKNKIAFQLALCCSLFFTALFTFNNWQTKQQNKLIVYNVPKHQAIDFVSGNNYQFIGDSILSADETLQNLQLKPGRIALQLNKETDSLPSIFNKENFYLFKDKRVLLVDSKIAFTPTQQKTDLDIIVISKSPKLYISQLASVFNCKQYVFDGSNSLWKIGKWKKDCEKLHLPFYSIPDQGAFILNVE